MVAMSNGCQVCIGLTIYYYYIRFNTIFVKYISQETLGLTDELVYEAWKDM
jgi:hypothetical protein